MDKCENALAGMDKCENALAGMDKCENALAGMDKCEQMRQPGWISVNKCASRDG